MIINWVEIMTQDQESEHRHFINYHINKQKKKVRYSQFQVDSLIKTKSDDTLCILLIKTDYFNLAERHQKNIEFGPTLILCI